MIFRTNYQENENDNHDWSLIGKKIVNVKIAPLSDDERIDGNMRMFLEYLVGMSDTILDFVVCKKRFQLFSQFF